MGCNAPRHSGLCLCVPVSTADLHHKGLALSPLPLRKLCPSPPGSIWATHHLASSPSTRCSSPKWLHLPLAASCRAQAHTCCCPRACAGACRCGPCRCGPCCCCARCRARPGRCRAAAPAGELAQHIAHGTAARHCSDPAWPSVPAHVPACTRGQQVSETSRGRPATAGPIPLHRAHTPALPHRLLCRPRLPSRALLWM